MDQGIHAEHEGETNFFATFLAVSRRIQHCCFRAGGGKGHFFATCWHRILQEKIQLENSGNLVLGLEGGKDTFLQQFLHEILQEKILVKQ